MVFVRFTLGSPEGEWHFKGLAVSPSSQQEGWMNADLCHVTYTICGKRLKVEKTVSLSDMNPKLIVTRADARNGSVDV